MAHYLIKTDPDTYGIDDFEREGETIWDGVHNFEAINAIKKMHPGDKVYVYHSQSDKAIMARAEVSGEPFENKDDPRFSWAVKLRFLERTKPVTLTDIKAEPAFASFKLVTHSRLSVMEVPEEVVKWLEKRL